MIHIVDLRDYEGPHEQAVASRSRTTTTRHCERRSLLICLDKEMTWLVPHARGVRRSSPMPPFSSACRSRFFRNFACGRPPAWWRAFCGWRD